MTEDASNDRNLVRRCLKRDEDAWNMLIRKHNRRVYNLCYQFCGSTGTAEDLTQDVFLKVYGALDRYNFEMEFPTWLMAVARNLCIDHYRQHKREKVVDIDDASHIAAPPGGSPLAQLERREAHHRIHSALVQVSDDLRMAVVLRDIQGYSYDEISAITGVPIGTVKSRINRGRLELARVLVGQHTVVGKGAEA